MLLAVISLAASLVGVLGDTCARCSIAAGGPLYTCAYKFPDAGDLVYLYASDCNSGAGSSGGPIASLSDILGAINPNKVYIPATLTTPAVMCPVIAKQIMCGYAYSATIGANLGLIKCTLKPMCQYDCNVRRGARRESNTHA
jgi:hypothetical protein